MPTILNADPFKILKEFVYDLEGSVAIIAFCGKHKDIEFVRGRIKSFKKEWEEFENKGLFLGISIQIDDIKEAYGNFMSISDEKDSDIIRQQAQEVFSLLNSDDPFLDGPVRKPYYL